MPSVLRSRNAIHFDVAVVTSGARMGWLLRERQWCKVTNMVPFDVRKFAPVTLGHMRSQGCRELLVYCNSGRCKHSTTMNLGHLPDDTPIKSLGDGIVCARCGHIGADVVPNWPSAPRAS
jgi:hypothetical protein